MITDVSLIVLPQDEHNEQLIQKKALQILAEKGISADPSSLTLVFGRKSIDARHGQVKLCLRYKAYIGEKPGDTSSSGVPVWKHAGGAHTVIIIGSGPAGLFGALRLLEDGIRPVIIERGEQTQQRKKDIAEISTQHTVGENSNYCFGEGGAGTFSDGKLYTRSSKRGDISRILSIFCAFGADRSILTDAHPHIGTDRLPAIINAMRAKITELGGEFRFSEKCTAFMLSDTAAGKKKVCGIRTVHTKTGEEREYTGDAVLLASGHSASDIYELLAETAPAALEAKTFAAGVRVEHPRELIDRIQYHGQNKDGVLPTAEYRLVTQIDGRGVYSFCMCPGGFVVPSATGPDEIVVNGMSSAARNSQWSNSAIVVETRPEDIPAEFRKKAEEAGCPALAGLYWRTWLEHEVKNHGNGQAAPAQLMTDFLARRASTRLPSSSYTPGITPSRLDEWLPPQIADRLAKGFTAFNRDMKGFICPEALMIAGETRTSTPVRILRDKDTFECTELAGLYPAGEGSGYSGGIVSSAMDGENAAAMIIKSTVLR
jgi:uncharacterized FAD-dependent dehydrogenase